MRPTTSILFALAFLIPPTIPTYAKELDFLQTDPRFTGNETNPKDATHTPTFWFYDQYADARHALQADGVALIPVTKLTYDNLDADSDALYMPQPSDPAAKTYPLTDDEIATLKKYTANSKNTGGRTIIFDLGNASSDMVNDLLKRLDLNAHMARDTVSGQTAPPPTSSAADHPILKGPVAAIAPFTLKDSGYFDTLGTLRTLLTINNKPVVPYVEKGDLSKTSGAYIFLLQKDFLVTWKSQPADAQHFFVNIVEYATQDQPLHFIPPKATPRTSTTKPATNAQGQ